MTQARRFLELFTLRRRRTMPRRLLICGEYYNVVTKQGTRNGCIVCNKELHVTLKDMTHKGFEKYYSGWYRRKARALFLESMTEWVEQMQRLGYNVEMPQIKIYRMHRAWGRCYYTKGVVTLSLYLALLPRECIDYVVMHELSHFVVHTHRAEFYAVMDNVDPQWREKERHLREFVVTHKIF